ncbi:MAG: DapH/DapD/GlmU-related protein [archaeon]|jgi:acetyltransferase-like isoleucine patch superfamily enzyme
MRNVKVIAAEPGKSASAWLKVKPLPVVLKNWFFCKLARISPGNSNQFFYRLMGVKIGKNAQIMPSVEMDIFFPELISIGEGAVIGIDCFFACHEFNPVEFRYGPISIGKNSLLGARSFVLPGVSIGDGAMVSAQTTVYKDIPSNVFAFGSPLQFKEINSGKSGAGNKNKK